MEQGNIHSFIFNCNSEISHNPVFQIGKSQKGFTDLETLLQSFNIIKQRQELLMLRSLNLNLEQSSNSFINVNRMIKAINANGYIPVSIRQYDRIIKRRKQRAALGELKQKKNYFYESRHKIALKRKRGLRGRFLPSKVTADCSISEDSTKKDTDTVCQESFFYYTPQEESS